LRAHLAFPSAVRGPVDFAHGLVFLILSACLSRDSAVQRGIQFLTAETSEDAEKAQSLSF
jgi:hypothetical protein